MRITDLQQTTDYRLIKALKHEEIVEFIRAEMQQRTWVARLFIGLNVLLLAWVLALFGVTIKVGTLPILQVIKFFALGIVMASSILIPIHEWIHGLAYKWAGASKIAYGGNWKKFYFYAVAPNFVVNRRKFLVVAIAPFAVITTLTLIGIFLANPLYDWVGWGVLLIHTTACIGDFGLLNFYARHKQEIYTYDDIEENVSYFYERVTPNRTTDGLSTRKEVNGLTSVQA